MATFLVLIYGDEQRWAAMTDEEERRLGDGHRALREAAGARLLATHELRDSSEAKTLRADGDGSALVLDGPFVESKEVIGGYCLLEAADMDAAVALVGALSEASASHGGVEIREVVIRA